MSQKHSPRELGSNNIWATEYHKDYAVVCDRSPEPSEDESSQGDDRLNYPRLVARDGTTRVKLQDDPARRGGCFVNAGVMFHTMITWGFLPLFLAFFCSYAVLFIVFGTLVYLENRHGNHDVVHLADDFWSSLFFTAYTMTTVGYGSSYPKNNVGSILPLIAIVVQLGMNVFWAGLVCARFMCAKMLAHTILFSNRSVIKCLTTVRNQHPVRQFACRLINLRSDQPWVDTNIFMFYASWSREHGRIHFRKMSLDTKKQIFMDIPLELVHEINPDSPLHELTVEQMADERGEIVVELEGYDPITGNGMKKRFSYIASEVFADHVFYDSMALDSKGTYVVNLTDFHRTKSLQGDFVRKNSLPKSTGF